MTNNLIIGPYPPDIPDHWPIETDDSDPRIKISDAQRIELGPDDVLVLFSERPLPNDAKQRMAEQIKQIWPDNRVLILDNGMHIAVLGSLL